MNGPRRFIQIVQIIFIADIVKTTFSALSHKANSESKTEINVIVVLNNSNAESDCQAPPIYTLQESDSAEQNESAPNSTADSRPDHSRVRHGSDYIITKQEFFDKVSEELTPDEVCIGTPNLTTDFYFKIKEMIMPFFFEKERNVPRYKYTVLFPEKVEYNRIAGSASILMTFRTRSKFERNEIGSADLWFMNGNYNPTFNLFRMTVHKIKPNGKEDTYKNIVVEGGEWFNVPVESMNEGENLSEEDKWFFISDLAADTEFRIEIVCGNCDREQGPAMKDFNPFIVVKKKFTIKEEWESLMRPPNAVTDVNDYCYMFIKYDILWLLWPKEITIGYCRGTCTEEYDPRCVRESSLTAYNISLPHCCIPVRFSPLEVIYLETPDIVVYEGIPDLIVEECGCNF